MGHAMRQIAGDMGFERVQDLVGCADRLVQVSHVDMLDTRRLLTPTREAVITAPASGPRYFRPFNPPPPHRTPEAAEERLAAGATLAVHEDVATARDRNVGTDLAGLLARGRTGVHTSDAIRARVNGGGNGTSGGGPSHDGNGSGAENGHALVELMFRNGASPGMGFGAFNLDGVTLHVEGGAQDGVGKCALGGEIAVLKSQNAKGDWVGGHVGKSFAYGAQRGLFHIQGNCDTRAAIRLSGSDMVLGAEPSEPLNDKLGSLATRANCKGFAFEYMTGGRVVVLGDPGPWICSGMTGGVVYQRLNPAWNLDEAAIRRRLSKAAKVSLVALDEADEQALAELLGRYAQALAASGQHAAAARLEPLIEAPSEHFVAITPVTQQADPNISTE